MKKASINLHMELRKSALAIVAFSLIALFLNLILLKSLDLNIAQLNSLWHSSYIYSATMSKSVGRDDFYQINAGIYFLLSQNAETSLNADIIMQSLESEYSEQIYWKAKRLSEYGVAISIGIAEENNLTIGDRLYSKRIVDGKVCEYTIEQILPEITSVRVTEHKKYSDGVIIMGYDGLYIDNISHNVLIYTKEPVNKLLEDSPDMPTNIVYRDDEVTMACKDILPYIIAFVLLSVLYVIGLVIFLTKSIAYNFRRQVTLGFSKHLLDKTYICNVGGIGFLVICLVCCTTMMAVSIEGNYISIIILVFAAFVIEVSTLIVTSILFLRRLWRR